MRKDRVYKLLLFLDLESSDIVAANNGCPAGKGPCASCKHIGAMCFTLEEFIHFEHLPEFLTCTDQLQQWNRPRPKKLEVILVAEFSSRRSEILKKVSRSTSVNKFDPRPTAHCKLGCDALQTLLCNVLAWAFSFCGYSCSISRQSQTWLHVFLATKGWCAYR